MLAQYKNVILYCPIVGMMGGFSVEFIRYGNDPALQVNEWSRMGSGTDRVVTQAGIQEASNWCSGYIA